MTIQLWSTFSVTNFLLGEFKSIGGARWHHWLHVSICFLNIGIKTCKQHTHMYLKQCLDISIYGYNQKYVVHYIYCFNCQISIFYEAVDKTLSSHLHNHSRRKENKSKATIYTPWTGRSQHDKELTCIPMCSIRAAPNHKAILRCSFAYKLQQTISNQRSTGDRNL